MYRFTGESVSRVEQYFIIVALFTYLMNDFQLSLKFETMTTRQKNSTPTKTKSTRPICHSLAVT